LLAQFAQFAHARTLPPTFAAPSQMPRALSLPPHQDWWDRGNLWEAPIQRQRPSGDCDQHGLTNPYLSPGLTIGSKNRRSAFQLRSAPGPRPSGRWGCYSYEEVLWVGEAWQLSLPSQSPATLLYWYCIAIGPPRDWESPPSPSSSPSPPSLSPLPLAESTIQPLK